MLTAHVKPAVRFCSVIWNLISHAHFSVFLNRSVSHVFAARCEEEIVNCLVFLGGKGVGGGGWAILTRPRLGSKRTEGQVCSTELLNRRHLLQSFAISYKMEKFYHHLFKLFQRRFSARAV